MLPLHRNILFHYLGHFIQNQVHFKFKHTFSNFLLRRVMLIYFHLQFMFSLLSFLAPDIEHFCHCRSDEWKVRFYHFISGHFHSFSFSCVWCVRVCICIWRPKVSTRGNLLLSYIEAGSLSEPETHQFGKTRCPASFQDLLQVHATTLSFLYRCWGANFRSLWLHCRHLPIWAIT